MKNAKNTPLSAKAGTVPDLSNALRSWFQPMSFENVAKTLVAGEVVESPTMIAFRGVIMPFKPSELWLKPIGQRTWRWFHLYAETQVPLKTDDVVNYLGIQTRVMFVDPWDLYGVFSYQLVQDWTGAGP